jgi:hypothetical protein
MELEDFDLRKLCLAQVRSKHTGMVYGGYRGSVLKFLRAGKEKWTRLAYEQVEGQPLPLLSTSNELHKIRPVKETIH